MFRLPALVTKAGRYDESKHRRGNPKNAGQFSQGGGAGGGAKKPGGAGGPSSSGETAGPHPATIRAAAVAWLAEQAEKKPAASVSRDNPDLDAFMGAEPEKKPAPPSGDIRHNPDLDDVFNPQEAAPARFQSAHNPAVDYANPDDRDSDDAHHTQAINAAHRHASRIRGELSKLEASRPTADPSQLHAINAKIAGLKAEHAAHGRNIKELQGKVKPRAARQQRASKPPADHRQARSDRMAATGKRISRQRDRGKDTTGDADRPSPIPLERTGAAHKPASPPPLPKRSPGQANRQQGASNAQGGQTAQPPALPHHRTQAAVLEHGNNLGRAVRSGDHAEIAKHRQHFESALFFHERAGHAEIERRVRAQHGHGAHADRVIDATKKAFSKKLNAARKRVSQHAASGKAFGLDWLDLEPWPVADGVFRLPGLILKAGRYDESKHRRGDGKNRGHFSSGGGGGASEPAAPHPGIVRQAAAEWLRGQQPDPHRESLSSAAQAAYDLMDAGTPEDRAARARTLTGEKPGKAKPAAKPAKAGDGYGEAGADHPHATKEGLKGVLHKQRIEDHSDAAGLIEAGPPPGLDMAAFGKDVGDLASKHAEEHGYAPMMHEAYADIGKKHGLSKHDFLRAAVAAHKTGDMRLSNWGKTVDEVPDPQLLAPVGGMLGYYLRPGDKAKAFNSSKHPRGNPRNRGQFAHGTTSAAKPSPADASGWLNRVPVGKPAPQADEGESRARSLAARIKEVPGQLRQQVTSFVRGRYRRLAKRYGPKGAYAILGAAVLLLPMPVPGSSLIPIAVAECVLALKRMVGKADMGELDDETIQREAKALLEELYAHCGEKM